jgi:hypothetical protein
MIGPFNCLLFCILFSKKDVCSPFYPKNTNSEVSSKFFVFVHFFRIKNCENFDYIFSFLSETSPTFSASNIQQQTPTIKNEIIDIVYFRVSFETNCIDQLFSLSIWFVPSVKFQTSNNPRNFFILYKNIVINTSSSKTI